MKKALPLKKISLFLFSLSLMGHSASAHSPIFACTGDGEERISCAGGFSNGSSAEGVVVRVLDSDGSVLEEGKLDAEGKITLQRPSAPFSVQFFANESHNLTVRGEDIRPL